MLLVCGCVDCRLPLLIVLFMARIELILILFIVVVAGACCCYIVIGCFWLDFWVGFGFRLCLVVGGVGCLN